MTSTESAAVPPASQEEIQKGWNDLTLKVKQLEAEAAVREQENKNLRTVMERLIEHRQKSHSELVLILSGLVSKLPINDVGVIVSKLVEHNAHVSETCTALAKGKADAPLPQPMILKAMEQTRRDLAAGVKSTVDELLGTNSPLDAEMLKGFVANPDTFFSPPVVRATRGLVAQVDGSRISSIERH